MSVAASESYAQGQMEAERQRLIEHVVAEIQGQNWTDHVLDGNEQNLIVMAVLSTLHKLTQGKVMDNPEYLLQFFEFEHLPLELQDVSSPFHSLAHTISEKLPRNPERTTALRKLLEAKDCAVRAALFK